MILIKIESLSTQELRNIAQQKNVDDWDELTREELISELKDIYEQEDDRESGDGDVNRRFLFGITDYRDIDKDLTELPGVQDLPELYPITSIHLLYKNPDWAYCYWSISPQDHQRLIDSKASNLVLRVTNTRRDGSVDSFDLPITVDDNDWNIGLEAHGGTCQCSLMINVDEEQFQLAESNVLTLVDSYWLEHKEEISTNETLFRLYLTMLTNKSGEMAASPLLKELMKAYEKEDRSSWEM